MELRDFIRLFRKWLWLFVLVGIITGLLSYVIFSQQPPGYEAQVMISVGGYIQSPNPDTGEIRTSFDLAATYMVLTTTDEVLQATIDELELSLTTEQLERMMVVQSVQGTSLFTVKVSSRNPVMAADIANEIARQLILNSPSNLTPEQEVQINIANAEIQELDTQLATTRARLDVLDKRLRFEDDPDEIERMLLQRNVLIDQINSASANKATYNEILAGIQQRSNSLRIVEQAQIPTRASTPGTIQISVFFGILGFALAVGLALLFDHLDTSIRSTDDVLRIGLPVVGRIAQYNRFLGRRKGPLITLANGEGSVAEQYRSLRTRLMYSTETPNSLAFIFTSPSAGEGKSTTVANLAVTLAAANRRVLLVDADMRRPRQHAIFEVANDTGFSDLLTHEPSTSLPDPHRLKFVDELAGMVKETQVPGLSLITSGPVPKDPAELLGSQLMLQWFNAFQRMSDVDVLLFDTPPAMVVTDAHVLAATTGIPVVLVFRMGKTSRNTAVEVVEQLRQVDANVSSIVLNGVKRGSAAHTSSYYESMAMDTIPQREPRQVPEGSRDNGAPVLPRVPSAARSQTRELDGASVSSASKGDVKGHVVLLYVDGYLQPRSILVTERVTLGRYNSTLSPTHVDLDEFGAYAKGVSRLHIALYRGEEGVLIEDLGSINGTWLNGERLPAYEPCPLPEEADLLLGALPLRLQYLSSEAEAATDDDGDASAAKSRSRRSGSRSSNSD